TAKPVEKFTHEFDRFWLTCRIASDDFLEWPMRAELFRVSAFQTAAADVGLDATSLAAIAEGALWVYAHVAPLTSNRLRAGENLALVANASAAASAYDDAEYQPMSPARSHQGFGHGETVGVVLNFNFTA